MSPTPRLVRRLARAPIGAEHRTDSITISLRAEKGAAPPVRQCEGRVPPSAFNHGGRNDGHQQKEYV
eukprot:4198403-Prymnesium_polylepis.1